MIGPGEEEWSEAARIDLLQLQFFLGRDAERASGPGFVHSFAISSRGERDVVGILVTPFNFERGDAGFDNLGDLTQRVKIAGRQQIARVLQRFDAARPPAIRKAAGRPARIARG